MTETLIWISQKEVLSKSLVHQPGTLFIPRLSVKLHLKVWNNFYSYTNSSPDEVKQVKDIYGRHESKNMKKAIQQRK
jgi:hypothetical protein